MKLFRNPHPNELEKLITKHWTQDSTVLHYTGHMLGIGCRLSSTNALDRISSLKQRTGKEGFIALICDLQWLGDNNIDIPALLVPICQQYWPGNLTLIFPTRNPMFAPVTVNGKTAFRVPTDSMLRQIIDYLGEPMISTSINVSGLPPAETMQDIDKRYANWFDLGFISSSIITTEPSTIIEYADTDDNGKPIIPRLKCLRESSIPFYEIRQSFAQPAILFVCTGNICRSPIAEYLFNKYSKERNLNIRAKSAGLLETGAMISLNSMQLLAEKGINAQEHLSRKINTEILSSSWLIFTMEEAQRDIIRNSFPEFRHKIFTLKEYIGQEGDIADPIGKDSDYYRDIYGQIDEALLGLLDILGGKC